MRDTVAAAAGDDVGKEAAVGIAAVADVAPLGFESCPQHVVLAIGPGVARPGTVDAMRGEGVQINCVCSCQQA